MSKRHLSPAPPPIPAGAVLLNRRPAAPPAPALPEGARVIELWARVAIVGGQTAVLGFDCKGPNQANASPLTGAVPEVTELELEAVLHRIAFGPSTVLQRRPDGPSQPSPETDAQEAQP